MNTENKSKNNPLVVILIFLVTAVVVFSTVFLMLYLNSDFKEIKANKTEYYVNVGETVKLDLSFTNILIIILSLVFLLAIVGFTILLDITS